MHASPIPVIETGTKNFLLRLKQETTAAHRKLESAGLSMKLMDPEVTLPDYQAWLSAMLPVVRYTEKIIFPITAPYVSDIKERIKSPKIIKDLEILGGFTGVEFITPLKEWHNFLPGSTQALAHMYVMEGSTLGGTIISKHLNNVLGLDTGNGAGYFNCYAGKTGQMWKTFLDSFTEYVASNSVEEEIINEANCVFSNLYNHFESSTR